MRKALPIAVLIAACAGMWLLPGPRRLAEDGGPTIRAEVVETDDSGVARHGLVEFGTQRLMVRLPDGTVCAAANELRAQMELDKKFAVGDVALVAVPGKRTATDILVARDHWRLGWGLGLFAAFCVFLCAFGGWTGVKALFSFVFSGFAIWKLLIPLSLTGYPASLVAFLTVAVLTGVIMYLVAGMTRTGASAFTGAMLGVCASLGLAHLFGRVMHVNGATMPFAQQLLYSGYSWLNLQDVFFGAIVLASSGAVMDLAMDIAAGIAEVKRHNPALGFRELFRSGLRMGRAVVGTMTTTLLLAYSGGYLTLLMVFAAQGTPPLDFLNSTLVSAELVKTLVGSFGLVLVAPFTALMGAWIVAGGRGTKGQMQERGCR
ncbi:MAG: YibE/F family protein [Kiritimatiellia bacterium]